MSLGCFLGFFRVFGSVLSADVCTFQPHHRLHIFPRLFAVWNHELILLVRQERAAV